MSTDTDHPEAVAFNIGLMTLFKKCWDAPPVDDMGIKTRDIMLTTLVCATAIAIASLAAGDERKADELNLRVEDLLRQGVAKFIAHVAKAKGSNQ